MTRFNAPAAERATAPIVEIERGVDVRTSRIVKGIAAVGLSAAAVFGIAPANADEIVIVPGMGDPSGQGYEDQLRNTGQVGPNDRVWKVPYSASIWPLGPIPMEQSVQEAVNNGRPVLDQATRAAAPGEKVVIRGYSEGGPGAARLANERSGGGPVAPGTVIFDGAPVSEMTIFNNQDGVVRTFMPLVTNMLQIPTTDRGPAGSEIHYSQQDVWANGGTKDLGGLVVAGMDTFMGPAHWVQDPRAPHSVWVDNLGIVHHEFPGVGTGGAPMNAVGMGAPVAPAPVPNEQNPRWVPNAENFTAVRRDWKNNDNHPVEQRATQQPVRKKTPASEVDNSRVVVRKSQNGGVNKQTTSYSKKFTPAKH